MPDAGVGAVEDSGEVADLVADARLDVSDGDTLDVVALADVDEAADAEVGEDEAGPVGDAEDAEADGLVGETLVDDAEAVVPVASPSSEPEHAVNGMVSAATMMTAADVLPLFIPSP